MSKAFQNFENLEGDLRAARSEAARWKTKYEASIKVRDQLSAQIDQQIEAMVRMQAEIGRLKSALNRRPTKIIQQRKEISRLMKVPIKLKHSEAQVEKERETIAGLNLKIDRLQGENGRLNSVLSSLVVRDADSYDDADLLDEGDGTIAIVHLASDILAGRNLLRGTSDDSDWRDS